MTLYGTNNNEKTDTEPIYRIFQSQFVIRRVGGVIIILMHIYVYKYLSNNVFPVFKCTLHTHNIIYKQFGH